MWSWHKCWFICWKQNHIDVTTCFSLFMPGWDLLWFSSLQIVVATQQLSFSARYKATNDNLCSSKQLTLSGLTLFSSSFFLLSFLPPCVQSAHRFTPLGYMTVAYGRHKEGKTVKEKWKEWDEKRLTQCRYTGWLKEKKKGEKTYVR